MTTYTATDWMPIQQRMMEAGLNDVPNGKMVDSFLDANGKMVFMVEFDTAQDELFFKLKWG